MPGLFGLSGLLFMYLLLFEGCVYAYIYNVYNVVFIGV